MSGNIVDFMTPEQKRQAIQKQLRLLGSVARGADCLCRVMGESTDLLSEEDVAALEDVKRRIDRLSQTYLWGKEADRLSDVELPEGAYIHRLPQYEMDENPLFYGPYEESLYEKSRAINLLLKTKPWPDGDLRWATAEWEKVLSEIEGRPTVTVVATLLREKYGIAVDFHDFRLAMVAHLDLGKVTGDKSLNGQRGFIFFGKYPVAELEDARCRAEFRSGEAGNESSVVYQNKRLDKVLVPLWFNHVNDIVNN